MRHSIQELPEEIRADYLRHEGVLFRSRVGLYILVTSAIYFSVSFQFLFRKVVLQMDTFRPWELSLWAILALGTAICHALNQRSKTRASSKTAALLYTGFFIWSFSGLAVVYPENIQVFVFYYAIAILFTSNLIPWRISEVLLFAGFYSIGFLAAFDYVTRVMKYPVESLPRFHQPFDGLVFIAMATFISVLIRRKEIERDLHNFALLKKVESQNAKNDQDLGLARRVHRTLVPDSFSHERADIWVSYIPMNYVSGDYAKFLFLDEDRLLVFISDVTGHGVAAALLVNRVHAEFERLVQERTEPAWLLKKLNDFISKDFEGTNMYLSAFCGLLDFRTHSFSYANYGHPSQYLFHLNGSKIEPLSSHNTLLGILPDGVHHEGKVAFEPGDRLLLFTDGVIEAMDPGGSAYGESRLTDFLRNHDALEGDRFNKKLVEDLTRFRNGAFTDDIYILNIKTKPRRMAANENGREYTEKNSARG